jgi:hypothetical protein
VGVIALALYDGLAFTIHNALLFALIGCVGALDSYHLAQAKADPLLDELGPPPSRRMAGAATG